ncbi:MAG: rhomboid family intramembrane serine protease [Planctomycetes bacterium]|nr:rhomboid family intramembrane serine protease [Planctomycetota bacterium]MCG2685019.1 rhomboid family intramembrane serine protease [Planctomycetales bacterium]
MLYHCPKCDGRAAGMSVLRRIGSKNSIRRLWQLARKGGGAPGADCPACRRAMAELDLPLTNCPRPLRLDVCAGCQFVWFDPREIEQFPSPDADAAQPLPEKAREILAMHQLRRVAEEAEKADRDGNYPDELWQCIPAMLGMPVEQNAPELARLPWLTYGLAAALVAVYALTAGHLRPTIEEYGLVPADMLRHGGVTFITSFFLHGGVMHLIGNVYFLLIFGDNVEDDLGWWRCAVLLAIAALVGDVVHIFGEPRSAIPCVGASGGISGIITYYALRFPHARVGFMFRYWFYFRWVSVPAWVALVLWFFVQLVFVYHQRMGIGNVAGLAHLGGAAVGLAAWLLWQAGGPKEREVVL